MYICCWCLTVDECASESTCNARGTCSYVASAVDQDSGTYDDYVFTCECDDDGDDEVQYEGDHCETAVYTDAVTNETFTCLNGGDVK